MKKQYAQPELEMRKVLSFETTSTSGDGMTGDDNEFDAGEAWPEF